MVCEVARARAPALGVKSRSAMARSIRRRVSAEIDRLPESAYETVLRATPARLATSSMVAILGGIPSSSKRFDSYIVSANIGGRQGLVGKCWRVVLHT